MTLEAALFDTVRDLLRRDASIVLDKGKEYLVESRLKPLCPQEGFDSVEELIRGLIPGTRKLKRLVVEALTTNETSFFRDKQPFEILKNSVLPGLIERRSAERKLRIWCAASSSGQEPVSLGLMIRQSFPDLATWDIKILATDINEAMIERCKSGLYTQLEVARGLPTIMLVKQFTKSGASYKVSDSVLGMIDYKVMNLGVPFPVLEQMDVVLVRNVMIYFDVKTKTQILEGVHRVLSSDGTLILGTAESPIGLTKSFSVKNFSAGTAYLPAA